MFFYLLHYLKFLLTSSNQHGVHSPFVYHLVTKCFYSKVKKEAFQQYQKIRKNSLLNPDKKATKFTSKKAKLLIKVTHYFNPATILEMGTSLGLGTSALKIAAPHSMMTTVETSSKIAKDNQFDLIYFNGSTTKQTTLAAFERCLSTIHNETLFIVNNIYANKETLEAWTFIKQHPKVSVTVDVFYCGIVFFRTEQEKEHFKIRI